MKSLKEMLRPNSQKQVKAEPQVNPIQKAGQTICQVSKDVALATALTVGSMMLKRLEMVLPNSQKQVKAEPQVSRIQKAGQTIRRVNRGLAVATLLLPVGILVLVRRQHRASQV